MSSLHKGLGAGLMVAALAVAAGPGLAQDVVRPAAGQWTGGVRSGDDVQEYFVDLLAPLWVRSEGQLLFNLRGTFLEDAEQEANAGLVVRRLIPERQMILGANLYYDTRWTEQDQTFDQVGLGLELLSRHVDVRANVYQPLTDEEVLSSSTSEDTVLEGSGRSRVATTTTSQLRVYEVAMEGFDAEIGFWLPFLDTRAPTALFAGYYDFSADHVDSLSGFKARLESRIHPNVTLDAEWFEEEALNRTDYFVGVRVSLPFDFWNGARHPTDAGSAVRPFEQRMQDMVYRDFRIRTAVTGPVVVDQQVVTQARPEASSSSTAPRSSPSAPTVAPDPEPSNCYLDENGDVVCN